MSRWRLRVPADAHTEVNLAAHLLLANAKLYGLHGALREPSIYLQTALDALAAERRAVAATWLRIIRWTCNAVLFVLITGMMAFLAFGMVMR